MSVTTEHTGTTVTLVYSPRGSNRIVRQTYTGLTQDDIVAVSAALAGRRLSRSGSSNNDVRQLHKARHQQMAWYADRMLEALYQGLGRWFRLVPLKVRVNTVQALMDYLKGVTDDWADELVRAHAETDRVYEQASALRLRPRSAPENGPRVLCACCGNSALLARALPEGWTEDSEGLPHCPEHPVVSLVKGRAA